LHAYPAATPQPHSSTPAQYPVLEKGKDACPGLAKNPTLSQKFADAVNSTMGSCKFVIAQSIFLGIWTTWNILPNLHHFDPAPFLGVGTLLTVLSGYGTPFIMISQSRQIQLQNRQLDLDRRQAQNDYQVNIQAEREIEELHQKMDTQDRKIDSLTNTVNRLVSLLEAKNVVAMPEDHDNDLPVYRDVTFAEIAALAPLPR
jgi:uncharacterized membrane protein